MPPPKVSLALNLVILSGVIFYSLSWYTYNKYFEMAAVFLTMANLVLRVWSDWREGEWPWNTGSSTAPGTAKEEEKTNIDSTV
jgi:hypothetical protein